MPIPPPSPPPPPPPESASSLTRLIRTTLSYDTNVMLAAIISLLLVILFVLLLHLYTRWFLLQARRRSRSSVTVPRVLGSRIQRFTIIDTSNSDHSSAKLGLPFSIIASLPLFVHKLPSDCDYELDCAICLSVFEDEEIGRKLPGCGHAFHVACIDMWLHSHSTCPICRAAIQCINHNRKIDHVEIETTYPQEELRLEIVTAATTVDVAEENESGLGGSLSSSTQEPQLPKKVVTSGSSSSSRCGGKIHPASIVNGDEFEA